MNDVVKIALVFILLVILGKIVVSPVPDEGNFTNDEALQQQLDNWQPFD